jgi:hypothetical protein
LPTLTTSGTPTFNGDSTCTINSTGSDRVQPPDTVLDETQGWVAERVKIPWNGASAPVAFPAFFRYALTGSDMILSYYQRAAGTWSAKYVSAGVTRADFNYATAAPVAGDDVTLISAWTSTAIKGSHNGAAFVSSAVATPILVAATVVDIGSEAGANWPDAIFYWVAAGGGTLSDADAATLHGFGNTDPGWNTLPGSPTFLWAADDTSYLDPLSFPGPDICVVQSNLRAA